MFVASSVQRLKQIPFQYPLEGFGDFKNGGQVIHTVKYADVLMLPANKKIILQGITDSLV
jgi:hypothetical protein